MSWSKFKELWKFACIYQRIEDHALRGGYVRWHFFHFLLHEVLASSADLVHFCICAPWVTDALGTSFGFELEGKVFELLANGPMLQVLMSAVAVPDTCARLGGMEAF